MSGTDRRKQPGQDNPYTALRKACGVSLKDFCERYRFSKQTIISVETGRYSRLSDDMISSLGAACAAADVDARQLLEERFGASTLSEAYEKWQVAERRRAGREQPLSLTWTDHPRVSPMQQVIDSTTGSLQGFASLLKIPAAPLSRYAKGGQREMPKPIEEAFKDYTAVTYADWDFLPELQEAQRGWFDARA